jgi:hypothetical protein
MQTFRYIPLLTLLASLFIGCPTTTVGDDPDELLDPESSADAGVGGDNNEDPTFAAMGEACESNDDCEFGDCLNVFGQYNFKGYCSMRCSADSECSEYSDSTVTWSCQSLGQLGSHCMMECVNETCPEDYACLRNIELAEPTDLCQSLGKQCDNGTCPEGQHCSIGGSGYEYFSFCTDDPVGTLAGGDTCNPNIEYGMPCVTDADCPSDFTCPSEEELADRTCTPNPETRCAAFICWNDGSCASPCETDADCASGNSCQGFEFGVNRSSDTSDDDGVAPLNLCRPDKASGATCATNADCTSPEVCQMGRGSDGVTKMGCQDPGAGVLTFGDACSNDARTLDTIEPTGNCDTDICLDGTCSKYCEANADCGDGYQCVDNIVASRAGMTAKHCLKGATCTLSSDCGAGEICSPSSTASGFINHCTPAYGTVSNGGACDATVGLQQEVSCMDDTACEGTWVCDRSNHRCTPPTAERCEYNMGACIGMGYCTATCVSDSDCPSDSAYFCQGVPSVYDSQNTGDPSDDDIGMLKYCVDSPGSNTTCTKESDCAAADESCIISRDADGVAGTRCSSTYAAAMGEFRHACGYTPSGPVLCKTGFCDYQDGDTAGPNQTDDPTRGKCTQVCATNDDCGSGTTCEDFPYGAGRTDNVKICK